MWCIDMFEKFEQVEHFFEERKKYGIKPGLERIKYLLQLLDNPQDKMQAVHVAGTNGKGSTITFLKNALLYNGYQVGVFMSPSIAGLTGHIFTNSEKIANKTFMSLLNDIYPAITILDDENNHPTEFEIITVLAFYYFANTVDIALIETGMGGREDTTNCFKPILSIITTIDKDHTVFLGETLREIAFHKAGIIKEKTPVIIGEIDEEARNVIKQEAELRKSPLFQLGEQFKYDRTEDKLLEQCFIWKSDRIKRLLVKLNAIGKHQVDNCSIAIMALVLISEYGLKLEWKLSLQGIQNTTIPGRFEIIHLNPTVIVDGAHNSAGIRSFLQTVDDHYYDAEKYLVFAAFKDKDITDMLKLVTGKFSKVILTSFDHPRAASVELLANHTISSHVRVETDWHKIIERIHSTNYSNNTHYFITGSLNFIAQVRYYFEDLQNM